MQIYGVHMESAILVDSLTYVESLTHVESVTQSENITYVELLLPHEYRMLPGAYPDTQEGSEGDGVSDGGQNCFTFSKSFVFNSLLLCDQKWQNQMKCLMEVGNMGQNRVKSTLGLLNPQSDTSF